jgi:hypothetical protein
VGLFDEGLRVYENSNGKLTLQPLLSLGILGPYQVRIADLDGNGHEDVVAAASGVSILLNSAQGFAPPLLPPTRTFYTSFNVADLDGDGQLDVLGTSPDLHGIETIYGNWAEGLTRTEIIPLVVDARAAAAGDFNADGIPDLIAGSYGEQLQLAIVFASAPGVFDPPTLFPAPTHVRDVAVADFNHDGVDDVFLLGLGDLQPSLVLMSRP